MNSFNIQYTMQLLESFMKRSHFFKNISQKMNTFKALSTYRMFHTSLPRSQLRTYTFHRCKFLHFRMGLAHKGLHRISCTKAEKHVSYKIYKVIMNLFNIQYTIQLLESYIKRSHFFKNISQKMNTFKALSTYRMFHTSLPRSQLRTYTFHRCKFLHFRMGLAHKGLHRISCTKAENILVTKFTKL